jgi:hypothetical protein
LTESIVEVTLRSGRTLDKHVSGATGSPDRPPTDEQVERKLRTCSARALGDARAPGVTDILRHPRRFETVAALADALG